MIIPAIDLIGGKVVRLFKGNYAEKTEYEFSPLERYRTYTADGAKQLHLVDLDGAKDPAKRQLAVIAELIRSTPVPVQVGGGIRSEDRRTSGLLQFNPAARAARRSRGRPLVRIQSLGPCRVFITDLRYEHSTFFFSWSAVRWGGVFLSSGNRICGTGRLPQAPRGARLSPGKRLTFKINCAIMSLYAKRRESDGLDCLCRADQRSARPADSALTRSSFRLHGAPKRIS